MGLFDGLLQDPESLGVALGLLQGRGNGAGLLMQLGQSQAQKKQREMMEQLQRQQLEQGQMHMQMQREAQARQQQEQALAQRFQNPGSPGIPQPDAALGGGPGLPAQPPGFDFGGYAQALGGIDPARALQMQSQLAGMNQRQQPKFHVVGGALVPEPTNGGPATPVYQAPEKQKFQYVDAGGYISIRNEQGQEVGKMPKTEGPGAANRPGQIDWDRGMIADPRTGNAKPILGPDGKPIGPKDKPLTAEQASSAGYMSRMKAAESLMKPLEADYGKPGVRETILQRFGQTGELAANALPEIMGGRSSERQQYRQAQEDWVRAKLRKESGAVIADAEMAREIATYFPQPGDSPAVIKQKAQARQEAIKALAIGAGPQQPQSSGGWKVTRVN